MPVVLHSLRVSSRLVRGPTSDCLSSQRRAPHLMCLGIWPTRRKILLSQPQATHINSCLSLQSSRHPSLLPSRPQNLQPSSQLEHLESLLEAVRPLSLALTPAPKSLASSQACHLSIKRNQRTSTRRPKLSLAL